MEQLFKNMNEQIRADSGLKAAVLHKAAPRRRLNFRPLTAVAAILAVVLLATPVMATYIDPINDFLYQISPEMAERFTPIQKSTVKNGIKMEILSASIHDNVAEMVVSFEDLVGDRVTHDFLPEFEIRDYNPFYTYACGMSVKGLSEDHTGYDPETGIKTLLLTYDYLDVNVVDLLGSKITLTARDARKATEPEIFRYPLELAQREVMTVQVEQGFPTDHAVEVPFDGFGTGSYTGYEEWNFREEYDILTPGETAINVIEEISITGIAFVNGQLHIQSRCINNLCNGDVYLVDRNGNRRSCDMWNTFQIDEGTDQGSYKEHIFDISEAEQENYTLEIEAFRDELIGGPWKVTFAFTECDYEADTAVMVTEPVIGE